MLRSTKFLVASILNALLVIVAIYITATKGTCFAEYVKGTFAACGIIISTICHGLYSQYCKEMGN